MSHQMDSKNCCHGRYSFRGFERNIFNRKMNRFENSWLLQSLEKFIAMFGKGLVTFILVQPSKFPSITKKTINEKQYGFARCSFCC